MLQLTADQVMAIQKTLNGDKRKEIIIKVENGKLVIICSDRHKIA